MRRALLAAMALLASCADLFAPATGPLPDGAIALTAPADYARWWHEIDSCSGIRRDMASVAFFIVPDAAAFSYRGRSYIGFYAAPGRIVLSELASDLAPDVRHEMLHARVSESGHPVEYFVVKCGPLVAQTHEATP